MSDEQEPQVPTEMPLSKMRCPYSVALQFMLQGYRVARAAWEGSGEYIWLLPAAVVPVEKLGDPILKRIAEENGGTVECKAALRLRTELGRVETGWRPSMDDLLAADWLVVLDDEDMECPDCGATAEHSGTYSVKCTECDWSFEHEPDSEPQTSFYDENNLP